MSDVVISAFQPFPAASQGYSTTGTTIRIWYGQSFLDSAGILVQSGTGTTGFYFEAACTIDGSGIIHIPSLTIKATLNAQNPNSQSIQCYAQLFSNGSPRGVIFGGSGSGTPTGWVIPSTTPTTYQDLNLYNQATVLANPPLTFFTAAQTVAYFDSLNPASDASDVVKGITYLSVAPASAASPTAYGANDPAVVTLTGSQALSNKTMDSGTIATTQSPGDNSTKLATTAFVTTADNLKANLAGPTFTGTPTLPTGTIATTQSPGDSSTKLATTAFVTTADNLKANLASPTFSGTPTLPTGTIATTQSPGDSSTKIATTAFATTADDLKANKASPTFTGTVVIPTPFTLGAVSVLPTGTELNFVDGVTSNIQTQLDAKAPSTSPTLVTPTLGVASATSVAASSFLKVNSTGKLTTAPKTNDTWGAGISLDVAISAHDITAAFATSSTCTITPTSGGTAGDWIFINTINGAGGTVVVTFASTFHSSGTQSTQASRYSSIAFRSDGTRWIEQYRTTDLT